MNRWCWVVWLLCFTLPGLAQVEGVVVDDKTGQPLPDAYIFTTTDSAITRQSGTFRLQKPTRTLIATHVGYLPDTLTVGPTDTLLTIRLKPGVVELEPITIRGNLHRTPAIRMPSSVGYISPVDRLLPGPIAYVESLNQVPGVYVQSGTLNTNRITIRGIGSRTPYATNRVKAYYNEIPLTSGDGSTEIEDLNVSSIGSIEVLKGSKSALYGSGLGGVLVLNRPVYEQGIHGLVHTGFASYQTRTYEAGIQWRQKGFFAAASYAGADSEGWRENSRYGRKNFSLNTGFTHQKQRLEVSLLHIDVRASIPSSIAEELFEEAPESAAQNWLKVKGYEQYAKLIGGLQYKYFFSDRVQNALLVFFQSTDGYESRPFNILDDQSQKWGLRNIASLMISKLKLQLGIETLFENYSWGIYETLSGVQGAQKQQFSEYRNPVTLFTNAQVQLADRALLEAGVSLNTLSYRLKDDFDPNSGLDGDYAYDWILSPFVGINLPIISRLYFYSSWGHGFSAPSVEETLLPEGTVNPDLKPETGWNAEAGFRFMSEDKRLFFDACIYQMWVNNLLVTKRETEEIFYGANAGKTSHTGFEFSSTVKLNGPQRKYDFEITGMLHAIKATFTDFVDDGEDYTGNELPGIPRLNASLTGHLNTPFGVYLLPQYMLAGSQYLNDANDAQYGGYQLFHLKAGWVRKIGPVKIDVSLGMRNLLNEHFAAMELVNAPSFGGSAPRYYYPGTPRNYFASLKITY